MIGTKLTSLYGAYYPEVESIIVDFTETTVTIAQEDGTEQVIEIKSIRNDYMQPKGSPIGTYFTPVEFY